MSHKYLITGAAGHLGSALCAFLKAKGACVRGFVYETDDSSYIESLGVAVYRGDVTERESMERFFEIGDGADWVLIHTAAIVDINSKQNERMREVNVNGTKNVMEAAKAANIGKIVYVSSVHALPVLPHGRVMREIDAFDPEKVEGAYAKTKAEAAAYVASEMKGGLPACIVHPSGIIGPYPSKGNHLVQMIKNYIDGKLPGCVKGGYDFVDVRDCVEGIVAAAERGRCGQCYLLTGGYYTVAEMLKMLRKMVSGKRVIVWPKWLAKLFAPILARSALKRGKKPIYTAYSLSTLAVNARFSHDKATKELGYVPRELYETLSDTVEWLYECDECEKKQKKRRTRYAVKRLGFAGV